MEKFMYIKPETKMLFFDEEDILAGSYEEIPEGEEVDDLGKKGIFSEEGLPKSPNVWDEQNYLIQSSEWRSPLGVRHSLFHRIISIKSQRFVLSCNHLNNEDIEEEQQSQNLDKRLKDFVHKDII